MPDRVLKGTADCGVFTGRSSAWLEHLVWDQGVAGSNPVAPMMCDQSYGADEIMFCGYRNDPETELNYVRNRTYSPVLGRWIQRDPIGYAGGINLYEYVVSNPVGNVDSNGLWHWWNPFSWPIWHSVPAKAATEAAKHAVGGGEFCGAAEAIAPLANPGIFANARHYYDQTHNMNSATDPLYQGLNAIAGGTPWQDLPPAEQQAVQNWSQNAAKSLW